MAAEISSVGYKQSFSLSLGSCMESGHLILVPRLLYESLGMRLENPYFPCLLGNKTNIEPECVPYLTLVNRNGPCQFEGELSSGGNISTYDSHTPPLRHYGNL